MSGLRMCPLWPLHIFIMYAFVLGPLCILSFAAITTAAESLPLSFDPDKITVELDNTVQVWFNSTEADVCKNELELVPTAAAKSIANFGKIELNNTETSCLGSFRLGGIQLGKAFVSVRDNAGRLSDPLSIKVIREERVIDSVFTYSVAILVSIIYINFGCVLDWEVLKQTLRKPIGPAIGFACQFVLMPLISYGLGLWIFPDSPEMRLGLFFTGLSPAGGASNIWSVALDANVNLSITMTTISTIAAFGMFPFWLFTLGDQIFAEADMATPYEKIATYVISLVIPLIIGLLCQRYLPRFARIMVLILKPFSIFLILFIVIFACVTNTYLFDLFTWKIAAGGIGLPWLGYFGGFLTALAFRQPAKDVLAIAVETGVQNTGIAIFMLRFSLDAPEGDITTVIPVAVSIMTPIPLFILYVYLKIKRRNQGKADIMKGNALIDSDTPKEITTNGNYIRQP